jgi:2-polyprenyl-6-methoxyphenol hydroxylase-like FAD-dependent oxidoreductase
MLKPGLPMKILISGAGIAGPTLAYWLKRYGFAPTLVERAPGLRSGGYVIDFWGLGYDIAEMMGLFPALSQVGYHMQELRVVDSDNARVAGFGTRVFSELTGGRFITVGRSDLSRLIFETIQRDCEVVFDDCIVKLEEDAAGIGVRFERSGERRFDLVVGADGLHSGVRRLVFGPQERCEARLGYMVAAFETAGYRPRDERVYVLHGVPGRQVARFALHQDRTLFLFIFAGELDVGHDIGAQKAILKDQFGKVGWECPRILEALDRCDDLYFDRVSQIKIDRWSRGRAVLAGDAASCISLLGGQGTALAMTAAYVLAGELAKSRGQYADAFQRYEQLLRPYLAIKQRAAERFASAFVPRTPFGLWVRNAVMKAFAIPSLARMTFGRDIADQLTLPRYSV